VRPLNPSRPVDCLLGNLLQFGDDFTQARAGEPLLDAVMQLLDGLDDLLCFEPAEFGCSYFHTSLAA
jgi:hypothetical protein